MASEMADMTQLYKDPSSNIQTFWNTVSDQCQQRLATYSRMVASGDLYEREHAGADIADELRAIERIHAFFCARQNALRPILRLPSEILSHIFRLFVSDCIFCQTRYGKCRPSTPMWVTITRVCGHWRRIACEDSLLWSRILPDFTEKWVTEMLRRAQSAPLSISRKSRDIELASLVSDHAYHIRELEVMLPLEQMSKVTQALSTGSMSYLTVLHLEIPQDWYDLATPATRTFLPSTILTAAPRLHELVLHNVFLDIQNPLPSRFETFEYTASFSLQEHWPLSMVELSYLLQNAKSLKSLKLNQNLLIPQWYLSDAATSIHLPRLKDLTLIGTTVQCSVALSALHVPPTCRLCVNCRGDREANIGFRPLITSHIVNHLHRGSLGQHFNGVAKFRFLSDYDTDAELVGWRTVDAAEDNFDFSFKLDLLDTAQPLTDTFRQLSLRETSSLSFSITHSEYFEWDWPTVVDIFSNVTKLTLKVALAGPEPWWSGFFEALATRGMDAVSHSLPNNPLPVQAPSLAFPHLTSLEMNPTLGEYDERDLEEEDLESYLDTLYDMLRVRRENGVGVKELHLAGWLPDGADVPTQMRRLVPNVIVVPDPRL